MRKLLSVLLIVLVGLSLFTACSPESKVTEEKLVNVRLTTGSDSRALTASVDFDTKNFTWKYTAKKADTGLKTGETASMDEKDAVALNSTYETAALSQGKWNFTLYGYADADCKELVCTGDASNQLITTASHTVTIEVEPKQKKTGNIWIKNDIYITDIKGVKYSNAGTKEDIYTRSISVYKAGSTDALTGDTATAEGGEGYITYTGKDSGIYKVVVTYTFMTDAQNNTAVAATATKYINVYDYLTTKVEGSISETAQAAKIDISNVKIDANGTYSDTQVVEATFTEDENGVLTNNNKTSVSSSVNGTGISTSDNEKSTFTFPSQSLTKNSADGDVTMNYEFASPAAVNSADGAGYQTSQEMNGAAVGGIGAELEGATYTKSEDGESGTLSTTVESGLTNSKVDSNTSDADNPLSLLYTKNGDNGKVTSYNPETGALTADIPHFSKYILVSKDIYAIDSNGKVYLSLADAVDKTTAGSTIKLLQNVKFSGDIEVTKNLTIDLNGKTVTAESNALIVVKAGTLTVNNASKQTYIKGVYTEDQTNSRSTYTPALMSVGDDYYDSFESAIKGASDGATIKLLSNVELTKTVEISKSLTLDLGGKAVISNCRAFCVHSGTLTIKNGKIDSSGIPNIGNSAIKVDALTKNAGLKLESNATIVSGGYGIVAFADLEKKTDTTIYPGGESLKTATLDIYGKIESLGPCISGNGTVRTLEDGTTDSIIKVKINVYEGATLNGGIYQPNDGELNISGGTITSKENSAVEIRAGKATISGGTLSSSGSYSVTPNESGTTVTGAAVAVSQHSTKKAIKVTITGGTFSGEKQLVLVNPQKNEAKYAKLVEVTTSNVSLDESKIVGIKVDEAYYPALEGAIANLEDGQTIKLLNDVETILSDTSSKSGGKDDSLYIEKKNIVVDFNNKKLTVKSNNGGSYNTINIFSPGCTIKDGEIVAFTKEEGDYSVEGKDTGDTIYKYWDSYAFAAEIEKEEDKGTLEINNMTLCGGVALYGYINCTFENTSSVMATKYYSLYQEGECKTTINGGVFTSNGSKAIFWNAEDTYKVGDTIPEGKNEGDYKYNDHITIKNGEFKGDTIIGGREDLEIEGGTFSKEPAKKYLKSGYKATQNSDGLWVVTAESE